MRIAVFAGASGMGLSLSRHYAANGHTVTVFDRLPAPAPAEPAKADDCCEHPRWHAKQLDFNQSGEITKALQQLQREGATDLYLCFAHGYFQSKNAQTPTTPSSPSPYPQILQHLLGSTSEFQKNAKLVLILPMACLHDSASAYAQSSRALYLLAKQQQQALAACGVSQTLLLHGYVKTASLQKLLRQKQLRSAPMAISLERFTARAVKAIAAKPGRYCLQPALAILVYCDNLLIKLKNTLHELFYRPRGTK